MINLEEMSMHDLCALRAKVEMKILRRGCAIQREFKRFQKLAAGQGLSLEDLLHSTEKAQKVLRTGLPIKYRNPVNPSQGWSGYGRTPGWVMGCLAKGDTLEKLAVVEKR